MHTSLSTRSRTRGHAASPRSRERVLAASPRANSPTHNPEDTVNVYKHVCKAEFSHAVDRGVLHQLRLGVLRIDIDLCTVHELQIFKSLFSRLPRIKQLCIAKNQVPDNPGATAAANGRKGHTSVAIARIRQVQVNALKKATQGTLHLVGKLLATPRHCCLVSLALPGISMSEATAAHFEMAFKSCSTLREIDFRCQDLSRPVVAERVIRGIAAAATVQAVCLKNCRLTARSARYVGHLVRKNNERRDEMIWQGELRGEPVSKRLIRLQGLLVLDISGNDFGGEGLAEIMDVLDNDRWIAAVNVADNGVVDETVVQQFDTSFGINRTLLALRVHSGEVKTRPFPDYLDFLGSFVLTYLQHNVCVSDDTAESGQAQETPFAQGRAAGTHGSGSSALAIENASTGSSTVNTTQLLSLLAQAQIGVSLVLGQLKARGYAGVSEDASQLLKVSGWIQQAQEVAQGQGSHEQ